jgi:hypothetical protein
MIKISDRAFASCKSLDNIIIPDSVVSIGTNAFQLCDRLDNITFSNSIGEIGAGALSDTAWINNYSKELVIINNLLYTLKNKSAKKVYLPENITKICSYAFAGASQLEQIKLPEHLTEMGDHSFKGCKALQSIIIPEGIQEIKIGTFQGCEALQNVVIPESVINIEDGAFAKCSSLKKVKLKKHTKVSSSAFPSSTKRIKTGIDRVKEILLTILKIIIGIAILGFCYIYYC